MTRIAIIKREDCNPGKCDYLCMRLCPINRTGEECIKKSDVDTKPLIDEVLCTGCGICPNRCPFDAIDIVNLPEKLDNDPIHRYGPNGFSLYNLPIPVFGKVVGVIGRNGIGKSTAIQILAGQIKPNLGKDEAGYDKIIEYFKGTEAHQFFEMVKAGDIRLSLKPQKVEDIPRNYSGTVRDLLTKVDEKGKLNEYVELLEITKFLDSSISDISGGELQRVAICATVLKDANVYFFDEPTSYLDIKQRINVSRFIRSLADENTAVMIVEHDLIILDYLADLLVLLYGKPGSYGIASQTKSAKAGINIYLSGYLKEENVRFRDKALKFYGKPPGIGKSKDQIISWEGIKKRIGNFRLFADKGAVKKNKVISILGENGIGKTSFVKILAQKMKADEGRVEGSATLSYKPQYIDLPDDLVQNILGEAVYKYENVIMNPLGIMPLLTKKTGELSGGELQRVAIAECLSRKSDLYLMDEPSAYLDVEQRMIVSRVIRSIMENRGSSALVVDHDLLFADYISDNILVFDGIPAREGHAEGPYVMEEGMNLFLRKLGITMRRDEENMRPRINKKESQMDRKQVSEGKRYYS